MDVKIYLVSRFFGRICCGIEFQDYNRELFCVELPAVRKDSGNSMYSVNYTANTEQPQPQMKAKQFCIRD